VEQGDNETAQHSAAKPDTFEVGVIFVHGIGSQVTGATLLTWAEPLFELMSHLDKHYGFRTRVTTADALVGDVPEVTFEISHEDRRVAWLLGEARWAEAFHPSPASDVLRWAVQFVWRAARRGFAALFQQLWFSFTRRLVPLLRDIVTSRRRGVVGRLLTMALVPLLLVMWPWLFVMVTPFALMLLVLLFLPVLLIVAVAAILVLLGLQHVPVLGRKVAPLVADLITSIGDAHAYRGRAIQEAAMRQVLRTRLTDASRRCRSVVVVAHSQGAAIACRMLLEGEEPWPDALVTVGAGTSLLNEMDSVSGWQQLGCPPWINVWSPKDLVPAGPMGDTPQAVRSRRLETIWHHTDGGFLLIPFDQQHALGWLRGVDPPGCWLGTADLVDRAARSRAKRRRSFRHPAGTTTVVETPTPVSDRLHHEEAMEITKSLVGTGGGDYWIVPLPLPRNFSTTGPEEFPVANRWSVIRDHTSYSRNLTQVQYLLAHTLMSLSPATAGILPDLNRDPAYAAESLHVFRVRALAMARLICAVAATAGIYQLARLKVWNPLSDAVTWAVRQSESGTLLVGSLTGGLLQLTTLAVAGLGMFAALSAMLSAPWNAWHSRESLRMCSQPDAAVTHWGASGITFLTLYLLMLISSSAYWFWRLLPFSFFSFPGVLFMLLVTYLLWALIWPFAGVRAAFAPARPD
jgi:hypothetical protein